MSPLLGPILAQLVTLGVGDRTEVRYIDSDDTYSEVSTLPRVGLNFGWKHTDLSIGYAPSFTITPLEAKNPDVIVYHSAAITASYLWSHTTLTVSQGVSYGQVSFRAQALAAPTATGDGGATPGNMTPGATTTPPPAGATGGGPPATGATSPPGTTPNAATQIRASDLVVTYASAATSIGVVQVVSPVLSVSGNVGYLISGSVGSESSANYPVIKGPRAQASARYLATRQDSETTTLATQYVGSSNGNDAWILIASEAWGHMFDKLTSSNVGAGLSMTRNSQPDGLISYSVYPTFNLAISRNNPLRHGAVSFGLSLGSSPVIDPVRALVDPQINFGGFVGWGEDKFSTSLSAGSALSLHKTGNNNGALNSIGSAFRVAYQLATSVSIDTGVRAFWQSFEGETTIPPTYAAFFGLTFGAAVPLGR